MYKKIRNNIGLIILIIILGIILLGATYVNIGPTTEFTGDVGVPAGSGYYIDDVLILDSSGWNFTHLEDQLFFGELAGIAGTPSATFQLEFGNSGARIKNSAGELQARNAADDAYANFRALYLYGDGSNLTGIGATAATALTISAKAGEDIDKGEVVYISGAVGQFPQVGLADNTHTDKHFFCGIAAETKTTGQTILIRVRGELVGLNTSAFLDGDVLYLSTAGTITATVPTNGAIEVIGYVSYDHASQGKIIVMHHSAHGIHVPSGDDILIRMGDALGVKKVYFKDYANVEVAFIDSDGKADFTSLTLDTPLLIAEGGTNSGAVLANDLVMISNAGAIVEGVVTVTELGRLDGLGGIIVTDVTECTDLEGTALSITAGVLNVTEADPTVDSDAKIKAILVDEVTKTGVFTAGRIAKINNATGIIEMATNTDAQVSDAVTKAHTQNTDTSLDIYNALSSDHTYSGLVDTQLVGESVVFGDLLYFNWTDKEWKKTDADAAATMPGLRIALESKADGQACKMLVMGYIRDDSAFEFAGAMVYASVTPGAMSSTAPVDAGDQLQRIGVAKSADILFFNPSIDVGEI